MSEPAFEPRTRIVVEEVSTGYKRRPDYAEGASGTIERVHGEYVPADGSGQEFLYSVRFDPADLWDDPETNEAVYIDLWESALSSEAEGKP